MLVVEDENDVEVAAVAQFLAAQLAVADDAEARFVAVLLAQARPAPAHGDAQDAVGQRRQIVGHLLDADAALDVAHQGAEHLGVVAAAQQVEQVFLVVLAGGGQRLVAPFQLLLEGGGIEAVVQQAGAGQLVDDAGVLHHVARRPARRAQHAQQALVHRRALQQQGNVALAPQQRLDPVGHAQHAVFADAAFLQPLRGALQQAHQAAARLVAQRLHARVVGPLLQALVHALGELRQHGLDLGQLVAFAAAPLALAAALAWRIAAQQSVELLRHEFAVRVQLAQKRAGAVVTQRAGDPVEVGVVGRQDVGLLVVQVLDAVLDPAQEDVGAGQRVGRFLRHQAGARHALQRLQRGARAQLRELPAAHHLQQLHGEFDLADAAARQLDVVGALGPAGRTLGGVAADLVVQRAQRLEHGVIQVLAKHEGQHHATHGLRRAAVDGRARRDHAAFHPGKALPLAALHQHVFLQRVERADGGAGIAVRPQRQIDPEHEAVLGRVADQAVDQLDGAREVVLHRDLPAPIGAPGGLAIGIVDVDQVDVARHVQLARAELAHADDPQLGALAGGLGDGRAVALVELGKGGLAGGVQRHLGQPGHGLYHVRQRRGLLAVQHGQAFDDQLAQDAQCGAGVVPARGQRGQAGRHGGLRGHAGRQQRQLVGVAPAQALHQARMRGAAGQAVKIQCRGS